MLKKHIYLVHSILGTFSMKRATLAMILFWVGVSSMVRADCVLDHDWDGDLDGRDVAVFAASFDPACLVSVAGLFGSTDVPTDYLPGDILAPWEGGAAYYAAWPNGLPADDNFFPIAVWLQSPENTTTATTYKNMGINLHIGLWQGPTENQLASVAALPSAAICTQNTVGLTSVNNTVIHAWMHQDEPDNAQNGTQDPVPVQDILALYQQRKSQDPTRPVYLNLGQGVASDPWYGRGNRTNHPEDYPLYAQGADILSFDIYPMNTFPRPESDPPWFKAHDDAVAQNIWYVAYGVDRLRQWVDYAKPVWVWIETTNFNGDPRYAMTPAHVRAEVWMALIHGAAGIGYFCHQFSPTFIEAGLLANPEMSAAVDGINTRILSLAPILNTPNVANGVSVTTDDPTIPVDTMVKRHAGFTYLFAVAMRPEATQAVFTLRGFDGSQSVTVIDEDRVLTAEQGRLEDVFEGYEVHLYKVQTP
jgi:hypothetical protein